MSRTYQKVETKKTYIKYDDCDEGEILVKDGEYLGPTKVGQFGKPNYDFREEKTGKVISLNHAGSLAYQLENNVTIGDFCRVIYTGKEEMTKGKFKGKPAHTFELLISKSATASLDKLGSADFSSKSEDEEDAEQEAVVKELVAKKKKKKVAKTYDLDDDEA